MLQGLALLVFECQGVRHRFHSYAEGCSIGSIGVTVCQGVWHRFHRYTRGSGIALPLGSLNAKRFGIGYAGGSGIDSIGMPGGLA